MYGLHVVLNCLCGGGVWGCVDVVCVVVVVVEDGLFLVSWGGVLC